jgi:restriction system protein
MNLNKNYPKGSAEMAMPTFQEVMLPIMKFAEGVEYKSVKECVEHIEQLYNLTDEEKRERIPSGKQRVIYNRITWAISHMRKAGLVVSHEKRGFFSLTETGKNVLTNNPKRVDMKNLREFPSYREFRGRKNNISEMVLPENLENIDKTPDEIIGTLSSQLDLQLADDLLEAIYNNTPTFFESLVVDLLLKMGYGNLEDSGKVTKKSGDGGIDGVIKQDELGLDMIYIQAKRWDKNSTVSRPDIQKFAGALLGEGATKGVFITTANFAKPAVEYAKSVPNAKIILIDGLTLAKLMIKHDLGVSTSSIIRIKKVDSGYFEEQ